MWNAIFFKIFIPDFIFFLNFPLKSVDFPRILSNFAVKNKNKNIFEKRKKNPHNFFVKSQDFTNACVSFETNNFLFDLTCKELMTNYVHFTLHKVWHINAEFRQYMYTK